MDLSSVQTPRFEQVKQFINFVEGKSDTEPDEAQYPVHVLTGDTFLYHLNGGDADGEADPFVTDILVYPNAEYWNTLLNGSRQRPYFDLSISEYNTLRIPSAISEYDLYVDSGTFYEDVQIDGTLSVASLSIASGNYTVSAGGDLTCQAITATEITATAKTRIPTQDVTGDITLSDSLTGYALQSKPAGSNTNIALPASGVTTGTAVTVINCLAGKTTTFTGTLLSRGAILSEQYSAATIYFDGSDWYGIGDLV